MKQKNHLRELTASLLLLISITYSSAQTSKVAIISLADTTIVHQHVGLTIIGNFTDTLHLNLAIKQHIEEQLKKYLSRSYTLSIINDTPDLLSTTKGIYNNWLVLKKEVKNYISSIKDQYDYVIFIANTVIPRETNLIIPENTTGIYTQRRNALVYSTITFFAFRTSNLQKVDFYESYGKLTSPIKDFNLPEDKKSLTPEMLNILKEKIINHLDIRIEYFLAKTYLVPQNLIDEIKAKNP